MLLDYLNDTYKNGEPIFLDDIKYKNKESLRQEMKRLVDKGDIMRAYNGVYYVPYKTIFNTEGKMSIDKYIEKKYLIREGKRVGFLTGISLANMYGFTSQVPSSIEVSSNLASTRQRRLEIDGNEIIVYSPVIDINDDNIGALQFLDLMQNLDKYSEIHGDELKNKLLEFVRKNDVNFKIVKELISLYPDRVYKNIYNAGMMGEML